MKIDLINDNEINLVFLISDSTPEFNLPRIGLNYLLMETNGKLRRLTDKELEKYFLNNHENIKIYLFPVNLGEKLIINDVKSYVYKKLEDYLNDPNKNIVDINYIIDNKLNYKFSTSEIAKSNKEYINNLFENIERTININNKNLELIRNEIVNLFSKFDFRSKIELVFPECVFDKDVIVESNIDIPETLDFSLDFNKTSNINFDLIDTSFLNVYKKYEELKNKIDSLHFNFLITFSCFDAISTSQLLIDDLYLNDKLVDKNLYYYKYENGYYQYYLSIELPKNNILKISKDTYNISEIEIKSKASFGDELVRVDLGRIPLIRNRNHAYILTWDIHPSDLDSHMYVFDENFNQIDHICYYNSYGYNSNVNLDVDDTSSYGPETMTIEQINDKYYYLYTIHNFSEQGGTGTWNYNNNTKINVIEFGKLYTFQPKENVSNSSWWDVLLIYNGNMYVINSLISNSLRISSADASFDKANALTLIKNYIANASQVIKLQTK